MKPVLLWIAALVLMGGILCLVWRPVLLAIGSVLVVHDDLYPADIVHVISGPNYRVDYGIQLYQRGYGDRLFFTGRGPQADNNKRRAIRQGVPPDAVVADGYWVTSTYSEALRLQAFIAQSEVPIRSVIVSSDPYHMRRARWAYRQVLGDQVHLQMAPVPFELSPYRPQWWTHQRSRSMVFKEYLKIMYYFARYKFSRGVTREWLASLDRD